MATTIEPSGAQDTRVWDSSPPDPSSSSNTRRSRLQRVTSSPFSTECPRKTTQWSSHAAMFQLAQLLKMAYKMHMPTPCLMSWNLKELDLPKSEIHGPPRVTMENGLIKIQKIGLQLIWRHSITRSPMMECFSCLSTNSWTSHSSDRRLLSCTMISPLKRVTAWLRKFSKWPSPSRFPRSKSFTSLLNHSTQDSRRTVLRKPKQSSSTLTSTREPDSQEMMAFSSLLDTWAQTCTTLLLVDQILSLMLEPTPWWLPTGPARDPALNWTTKSSLTREVQVP